MTNIVTVTINPCIDKNTTVTGIEPEKKLRCSSPEYEPGGGGLNVSRAIQKLGGSSVAIYPAGGHAGNFLEELAARENLCSKVVPIRNNTRENFIVFDNTTGHEYRFGMPGPEMSEDEWQQLIALIETEKSAFVVVSGSIPPGVPVTIFRELANVCRKNGSKLVVDTSGEALKQVAREGAYLLKPNLLELGALAGVAEVEHNQVERIARSVIASGKCEIIIVSLGSQGAIMITKDEAIHIVPPPVTQKSTVGAGDSMVGGFVLSLSRGEDIKTALRYGVACGTAAIMTSGQELCSPGDVERLLEIMKGAGRTI
jgi:6-phosphofructokinase 2